MTDRKVERTTRPNPQTAWMSRAAARWYALDVNDLFHTEDLDLEYQVNLVSSLIPDGASIADIGCGTGALAIPLARRGYEVSGFDVSAPMMAQLTRRSGKHPVKTVEADVFGLDETFGSFDAAVSRWVLPHFENWGEIVKSVGRVVRPGGVFVFDMKNREHFECSASLRGKTEKFGGAEVAEPGQRPDEDSSVEMSEFPVCASEKEIVEALRRGGFELEARYSMGLFSGNQLISHGVDEQGVKKRIRVMDWMVGRSKYSRETFRSLANNLTPDLPPEFTFRSLVVARRAGT